MGNKHSKRHKKFNKNEKNEDDMDGFFLEDWDILYDKNKLNEFTNNKSKISFNNEILISQVKTDPFKDYTEIRELGTGSFTTVKLVKNNSTGMVRVMKIIKKKRKSNRDTLIDETNELEILNEINILKQIDHPNVVKFFEIYNSKDAFYLITEYCEGGELFKFLVKKNINRNLMWIYYYVSSFISNKILS